MQHFSIVDVQEHLEAIITALEQDERRYYVILDLAYQLRDELENMED